MTESFPRQRARTRNFSTGVPRAFQVSPDGARVTFLRTKSGDDPATCLWEADAATGAERLVADPRLLGADEENLPPEERARRERVRETGAGIVSYATDEAHTIAVFALSGQVYATRLGADGGAPRLMATRTPALDPRPDPSGTKIAYVHDGALRVLDLETDKDTAVAEPDGENVTLGLAEFVAAEEMGRSRGYWWSPDGREILVARVNETPVNTWHIADPAHPDREPVRWKYPAAGTPNADVRLFLATLAGGGDGEGGAEAGARGDERSAAENRADESRADESRAAGLAEVPWDTGAFPYLVAVSWDADPLLVVQSRDQKTMRIIHALTGDTLHTDTDPHWTDIIAGVPAQLPDGRVAWTAISDDTRRLVIASAAELTAAAPLTPPGLQVKAVLGTDGDTVYFTASRDPAETGVWCYGPDGLAEVAASPGVHSAVVAGGTTVVASRTLDNCRVTVTVNKTSVIESRALDPDLPMPAPAILQAGQDGIRTAVLFPSWHTPGTKLPVLMAPYGGPHHQEVVKSAAAYLQSQWFAEQGFAVVTADGHGTPSRGPAWERAIAGDFATKVLEDQVTALHAAAAEFGDLDTSRVGIRGWSFGGYLSALAVLRRPDVFHAAVAGAPVTDWRLYDTHYTERYLGHPGEDGDSYQRSSLLDDPERITAADQRSLLLIHGLADDNVLVAHSLRMSSALLAAGYPHSVLPLSGVTHMTPQEVVAENLLLLQVDFLRSALNVAIALCMCTARRQPTARRRLTKPGLAGLSSLCPRSWPSRHARLVLLAAVVDRAGHVGRRGDRAAGARHAVWQPAVARLGDRRRSFYTTELPEYTLGELARGMQTGTIHIAAAVTYTLLVLLSGFLARGRTRGYEGLCRGLLSAGSRSRRSSGSGPSRCCCRRTSRHRDTPASRLAALASPEDDPRLRLPGGYPPDPDARPVKGEDIGHAKRAPRRWRVPVALGLGGVVSNITSVQGVGRVRVAVVSVKGGRVAVLSHQSAGSWYDPELHDATFLVAVAPGPGHGNADDRVPRQAVLRTFGLPARVYHFSGYTVMIWDRNLLVPLKPEL